jgi:signal peptidase II
VAVPARHDGPHAPGGPVGDGHPRPWGLLAAVAATVLALDQLTKWWALEALDDGPVHVGWTLDLSLTFNTGTAFSFGRDLGPVIGLVAVAVVLGLLRTRMATSSPATATAVGLILGGALGNLADRAFRSGGEGFLGGAVVDFVDLNWWPVFNLADAAIVVGALALVAFGWEATERSRR